MILIIAEKPDLAKAIALAIPGDGVEKDGCIYKNGYTITWLFGHMLTLQEPEDYDEKYAEWSIALLPIYFPNWKNKIDTTEFRPGLTKVPKTNFIGKLMGDAEYVIHAGDPDEEGQLLVDELIRWFNYKGTVKRLDTGNTTTPALIKALGKMTDNKLHENAGWSAYARSVADLMVGVNMSRLFTCANNGVRLTVGRVQTPTLGMVVNRDALIESHAIVKYFEVMAALGIQGKQINTKFFPNKEDSNLTDGRILSRDYAEGKRRLIDSQSYSNISIEKKKEEKEPPLPFNLVKLQSYCSSKYKLSPSDTLAITQSLREKYKAITYNRSDCQYLSEDHFKEAPSTLATVTKNIAFSPKELDSRIKSKCFNEANLTAHFAIIPTDNAVNINALSENEKNVYLAICKYYLAQFLPKAIKEKTTLTINLNNGEKLQATSTQVLYKGYLSIFKDGDDEEDGSDEESELSQFPVGTYSGKVESTEIVEKETKPPARYTKASLNEDMTRIAKYVDDPRIKKLLLDKDKGKKGENGSIGTSATRSSIIDNLVKRGFLEEKGNNIISTPLGRELYRILPDEIKKVDMTAEWWVTQEDIRAGQKSPAALTEDVYETIKNIIKNINNYPQINRSAIPAGNGNGGAPATVVGKCPRCGSDVVEGKNGYGCSAYKNGCKFVIWKESQKGLLCKTKISVKQATSLLKGETITVKTLYSEAKDSTFPGCLKLNDSEKSERGARLDIVSNEVVNTNSLGKCPRCGGNIVETNMKYECTGKDSDGCKFAIWKKQNASLFKNIVLTPAQVKTLLAGLPLEVSNLYSESKKKNFPGIINLDDSKKSDYGPSLAMSFKKK